jgi:endonuclease-8
VEVRESATIGDDGRMPEGDTVWLAARRLDEALAGGELTRTDFRVPRLATVDLAGQAVEGVRARGKHLLLRVSNGWTVHSHLRMDGAWRVYDAGQAWSGGPRHQIRAVLATADRSAVGYRLPVLDLLRTTDERRVVGYLGPDLLGDDWDAAEAVRRLLADPTRPVGEALLDQRNLAGIGNVYKSELCFLRGVTPWTAVSDVPDPDGLAALAKRLLEANKGSVARVTTGDPHRGRTLWVYGRGREMCRRCGTPIRTAELGQAGEERVTYWCPQCQTGPGPNGED